MITRKGYKGEDKLIIAIEVIEQQSPAHIYIFIYTYKMNNEQIDVCLYVKRERGEKPK